jgi:uncharacterized protein (DUF305 family)
MSILQDKKVAVVLALIVMIVGTMAYFGTNAYLMGYDEEHFIKEMILHHQEAIDMSKIMLNSDTPAVRDIAEGIVDLQQKEIQMLESWLDEWYPEMGQQEESMKYTTIISKLSEISSKERDIQYLKGMVKHHESAIMMAEKVLKTNPRLEVRQLAEDIIRVQSQEIDLMKNIINDLGGVLV